LVRVARFAFQACAFSLSAISPRGRIQQFSGGRRTRQRQTETQSSPRGPRAVGTRAGAAVGRAERPDTLAHDMGTSFFTVSKQLEQPAVVVN